MYIYIYTYIYECKNHQPNLKISTSNQAQHAHVARTAAAVDQRGQDPDCRDHGGHGVGGEPSTLSPQPLNLDPPPSTLHPQPSTLDPQPSTLHPQPYTLNLQPSTFDPQTSNLKPQTSTLHPQPFTLHPQPSNLNLNLNAEAERSRCRASTWRSRRPPWRACLATGRSAAGSNLTHQTLNPQSWPVKS